jgi:hypothetical protein
MRVLPPIDRGAHVLAHRIAAIAINAAAAVVIAAGIFITLVSVGVIARPASESFTFGG